jgi:hypothetical protein
MNRDYILNFEILKALNIIIVVFWVVMPFSLMGDYQHSGGTYCPNPEDEGNTFLHNGIYLQVHTALQPTRPTLTFSPR